LWKRQENVTKLWCKFDRSSNARTTIMINDHWLRPIIEHLSTMFLVPI